jgi:hypothetical protein
VFIFVPSFIHGIKIKAKKSRSLTVGIEYWENNSVRKKVQRVGFFRMIVSGILEINKKNRL